MRLCPACISKVHGLHIYDRPAGWKPIVNPVAGDVCQGCGSVCEHEDDRPDPFDRALSQFKWRRPTAIERLRRAL